ncbi:MAG: hypothetical protein IPK16_03215 [Anaerolineales bacterium]|nr:hypothetical protein [Anaerolineales bacterium]
MEITIGAVRPHLVILTAQQLYTAASLLEMAEMLYREGVPVAFGGLVFTQVTTLQQLIPGYYLGDRLDTATLMVEQVMMSLRPQPAQQLVSYDYREALDSFRTHQPQIDADVWLQMEHQMPRRHLAVANNNLGRNIIAALTLGNIDYIDPDIDWIEGLLTQHLEMPPGALDYYLKPTMPQRQSTWMHRAILCLTGLPECLGMSDRLRGR